MSWYQRLSGNIQGKMEYAWLLIRDLRSEEDYLVIKEEMLRNPGVQEISDFKTGGIGVVYNTAVTKLENILYLIGRLGYHLSQPKSPKTTRAKSKG